MKAHSASSSSAAAINIPRVQRGWVGWLLAAAVVLLSLNAWSQARTPGDLKNVDVRYPCFQDPGGNMVYPNDIEIVIYAPDFPVDYDGKPTAVVHTFDTGTDGTPGGLGWGEGQVGPPQTVNDPASPFWGMRCLTIRWAGRPRPDLDGQMVHIGVHVAPNQPILGSEIWWTLDGGRIARPCDPHITWICSSKGWVICIENPSPLPIYIYGCRFFAVGGTAPLPTLPELRTDIAPERFEGQWVRIPVPSPVTCIQPWCRIYVPIIVTTWRPVVFQIGARNAPLDEARAETAGSSFDQPDPNDPHTMAILTGRAGTSFAGDANGDGRVGTPDLAAVRGDFGKPNPDL